MPAAELLKPRSLTAYGRRWERGAKVNITPETADFLEEDERFSIKRSQKAEEEVSHLACPSSDHLAQFGSWISGVSASSLG